MACSKYGSPNLHHILCGSVCEKKLWLALSMGAFVKKLWLALSIGAFVKKTMACSKYGSVCEKNYGLL